jgi:predicted signal transduction protein with EAL and GGDEF domain
VALRTMWAIAAIVEAVTPRARRFKLPVVAEGVGTAEGLAFVTRCGCDAIQGCCLSRPCLAADLAGVMRESSQQTRAGTPFPSARPQHSVMWLGASHHIWYPRGRLKGY